MGRCLAGLTMDVKRAAPLTLRGRRFSKKQLGYVSFPAKGPPSVSIKNLENYERKNFH